MNDKSILVIEDDRKTAASIRLYLEDAGYTVDCIHNGAEALDRLRHFRPLAVILDVMLPQVSGVEICKRIRREGQTPVLIVSARTEETDRLLGLRIGADDYITKPFSPRELVARVQAVLRRAGVQSRGPTGVYLDSERHEFDVRGKLIPLSPTEFRIAQLFVDAPSRVFTRDDVIRFALGPDFDGLDRTVDAHIMNIRRKVRNAGGPIGIISTVFGVGYRLGLRD
jgi:DNA-binding response OmpR family regulator